MESIVEIFVSFHEPVKVLVLLNVEFLCIQVILSNIIELLATFGFFSNNFIGWILIIIIWIDLRHIFKRKVANNSVILLEY